MHKHKEEPGSDSQIVNTDSSDAVELDDSDDLGILRASCQGIKPPKDLLSDAGLAIVSTFAARVLSRPMNAHAGAKEETDSEAAVDAAGQNGTGSDAIESTDRAASEPRRHILNVLEAFVTLEEGGASPESHDYDDSAAVDLLILRGLFAFLAPISAQIDILRKQVDISYLDDVPDRAARSSGPARSATLATNYENGGSGITGDARSIAKRPRITQESTTDASISKVSTVCGSALDRQGCAVLLLILYTLLENVISYIQLRTCGDVALIAKEAQIFFPPLNGKAAAQGGNDVQTDGEATTGLMDAFAQAEENSKKMVQLFSSVEMQIKVLQDWTISAAGLRLLARMARGTPLGARCASLSWYLMRALHTVHTDISVPSTLNHGATVDEAPPGLDSMWPQLVEMVGNCPFRQQCIVEVSSVPFKASKACAAILKSALFPSGGQAQGPGNATAKLLKDENGRMMHHFRSFFSTWWVHETSTMRLYGVAHILFEVFRFLKPVDASALPGRGTRQAPSLGRKVSGRSPRNGHTRSPLGSGTRKRRANGAYDDDDEQEEEEDEEEVIVESSAIGPSARHIISGKGSDKDALGNKSKLSFPSMTPDKVELFFVLAFSALPALACLSRPTDMPLAPSMQGPGQDLAGTVHNHAKVNQSGPYREMINIAGLFIGTLGELERVAEEGVHMRIYLKVSTLGARISKTFLDATEVALQNAIMWRSTQPMAVTSDDDEGGRHSDVGPDWGSAAYLAALFESALRVARAVLRYAASLKSRLVMKARRFTVPRGLARSVPQLQLAAERFASRVYRMGKTHSLSLRDLADIETDDVDAGWSHDLRQGVKTFVRAHDFAMQTPADPSSWQAIREHQYGIGAAGSEGATTGASSTVHHRRGSSDAFMFAERDSDGDEAEEGDPDFGTEFAALSSAPGGSSRHGGWGIYLEETDSEADEMDGAASAEQAAWQHEQLAWHQQQYQFASQYSIPYQAVQEQYYTAHALAVDMENQAPDAYDDYGQEGVADEETQDTHTFVQLRGAKW